MKRRLSKKKSSKSGSIPLKTGFSLVSPFVEKTFELVSVDIASQQNPNNKDLVRWSDAGDTLIISDINTFSDKILPEYFNHINYSSFIRQLNMYGFRKEHKEKKTKQDEYRHEYFKRGHEELLKNIKRKKKRSDSDDEDDDRHKQYFGGSKNGNNYLTASSKGAGNTKIAGLDLTMDDLSQIKPEMLKDVEFSFM